MTSYIRRFADLSRDDLAAAGGKGANLGELTLAGFPVPPGFVLTTAAYDGFIEATGIGATIEHARLPIDAPPQAYDRAAEQIRALFADGMVPDDVRGALRAAHAAMDGGVGSVAVRSSATAEDLADASFAGQQDTYLNVRGEDALLAAVRDCWASLWTARAMAYRARQGIDPATVSLAVVVQQMVEADAAALAQVWARSLERHAEAREHDVPAQRQRHLQAGREEVLRRVGKHEPDLLHGHLRFGCRPRMLRRPAAAG